MRRKLRFSYQSFVRGPSLIGLVVGVSQNVLPLRILFLLLEQIRGCFVLLFLFPLFTIVNSLCFSCFSFFNNILFLLIKKKKKKIPGFSKGISQSEHLHWELYSFVDIKWQLFDQLEFRLPLVERSSYLLIITTESHLGVLVRTCTLLKGATWDFSGTVLNMLAILSPIKLKN